MKSNNYRTYPKVGLIKADIGDIVFYKAWPFQNKPLMCRIIGKLRTGKLYMIDTHIGVFSTPLNILNCETYNERKMKELIPTLEKEGYYNIKEIPGTGICALFTFMFTTGLVVNCNQHGYEGRYCYQVKQEAEDALELWDGKGDPLFNWIKYKGEGGERKNPNYKHST